MLIFGASRENYLLNLIPKYYNNMNTKYWIIEYILSVWHHLSFYVSYTYHITLFTIWLPNLILGLDYLEICKKIDILNL